MSLNWINQADRLSALPPYVFARLDELKARAREQGLDLIDLGMGNPDGAAPRPRARGPGGGRLLPRIGRGDPAHHPRGRSAQAEHEAQHDLERRAAERRESEAFAFTQFGKACRSGDARKAHHAMLGWLERLEPGLTASDFARDWGDESLVGKLDAFSAAVYRDAQGSVPLGTLYGSLRDARQGYLGGRSVDARPALPPLNP